MDIKAETLTTRRLIRARCRSAENNLAVEVVGGTAAPHVEGEGCCYQTPAGKPVYHPSAYRRAFGRPVYCASTRRVVVGMLWLASELARRERAAAYATR